MEIYILTKFHYFVFELREFNLKKKKKKKKKEKEKKMNNTPYHSPIHL